MREHVDAVYIKIQFKPDGAFSCRCSKDNDEKLIGVLFSPFVFSLGFLAPLIAQVLASTGVTVPVSKRITSACCGGDVGRDSAMARQLVMGQTMNKSTSNDIDWDSLSEAELDARERQIASKYMLIVPWGAGGLGADESAGLACAVALGAARQAAIVDRFSVSNLNIMLCYLPSHEAQHSIIARKGHPLRWLNELVGICQSCRFSHFACYVTRTSNTICIRMIQRWIRIIGFMQRRISPF